MPSQADLEGPRTVLRGRHVLAAQAEGEASSPGAARVGLLLGTRAARGCPLRLRLLPKREHRCL